MSRDSESESARAWSGDEESGLPPASPVEAAPVPPSGPAPAEKRSRGLWVAGAIATVAIGAAGFLWYTLSQATQARDDAEAGLAASQTELVAAKDELRTTADELADVQQQLAEAVDHAAQAEEQLTDSEESLAATRLELDAALEEAARTSAGLVDFLSTSLEFGAGMDAFDARCVAESMAGKTPIIDLISAFMDVGRAESSDMFSDPELLELSLLMVESANDCGVDLGGLGGLQPGSAYGDNEALDALYDECNAGSGAACDLLYRQSAFGSEYESFGATCGERFPLAEAGSCEAALGR